MVTGRVWGTVGLVVLALGCWFGSWALGEQAPEASSAGEAQGAEELVFRIYPVGDLLRLVKDYPCYEGSQAELSSLPAITPDIGVGFGQPFGDGGEEAGWSPNIDDLIELIQRNVPADGDIWWDDEGGLARIDYFGDMLIISQTPESHRKIHSLLDAMRDHAIPRRAVTIEAKWMRVDEDKAAHIAPRAETAVPHEVSPAALEDAGAKVLHRARITCMDSQMVHTIVTRYQTYVADREPVTDENAVAYDPILGTCPSQILLEIRARVLAGGQTAMVDIRSNVVELMGIRTVPLPLRTKMKDAAEGVDIEAPDYCVWTLRTTVTVPLDKFAVVGGMSAPNDRGGATVYLVLRVSASK